MTGLAQAIASRRGDLAAVWVPNGLVLGFIHLVDVKLVLEVGLLALSFGYTLWRWRRDWRKG